MRWPVSTPLQIIKTYRFPCILHGKRCPLVNPCGYFYSMICSGLAPSFNNLGPIFLSIWALSGHHSINIFQPISNYIAPLSQILVWYFPVLNWGLPPLKACTFKILVGLFLRFFWADFTFHVAIITAYLLIFISSYGPISRAILVEIIEWYKSSYGHFMASFIWQFFLMQDSWGLGPVFWSTILYLRLSIWDSHICRYLIKSWIITKNHWAWENGAHLKDRGEKNDMRSEMRAKKNAPWRIKYCYE